MRCRGSLVMTHGQVTFPRSEVVRRLGTVCETWLQFEGLIGNFGNDEDGSVIDLPNRQLISSRYFRVLNLCGGQPTASNSRTHSRSGPDFGAPHNDDNDTDNDNDHGNSRTKANPPKNGALDCSISGSNAEPTDVEEWCDLRRHPNATGRNVYFHGTKEHTTKKNVRPECSVFFLYHQKPRGGLRKWDFISPNPCDNCFPVPHISKLHQTFRCLGHRSGAEVSPTRSFTKHESELGGHQGDANDDNPDKAGENSDIIDRYNRL
jgi:hypothetical protein